VFPDREKTHLKIFYISTCDLFLPLFQIPDMTTPVSDTIKIALLEAEILEEIRKTNPKHTIQFHYSDSFTVKVKTFNPLLGEFFTLSTTISQVSTEDALHQVLIYIKTHRKEYNSFTVTWAKKIKGSDDTKPAPSVFYCNSIRQVLDKFFDGKDEDMYIIYEIKMNPIA